MLYLSSFYAGMEEIERRRFEAFLFRERVVDLSEFVSGGSGLPLCPPPGFPALPSAFAAASILMPHFGAENASLAVGVRREDVLRRISRLCKEDFAFQGSYEMPDPGFLVTESGFGQKLWTLQALMAQTLPAPDLQGGEWGFCETVKVVGRLTAESIRASELGVPAWPGGRSPMMERMLVMDGVGWLKVDPGRKWDGDFRSTWEAMESAGMLEDLLAGEIEYIVGSLIRNEAELERIPEGVKRKLEAGKVSFDRKIERLYSATVAEIALWKQSSFAALVTSARQGKLARECMPGAHEETRRTPRVRKL